MSEKQKRMLLVQPTIYGDNGKLVKKKKLYFVGLTMPLLAAECPDDWEVEICIETLDDIPFDTDIDLIGIGSMGHSIIRGVEIATEFKRRGKTVVMGGYMASLVSDKALDYCDAVMIGDAEGYWTEMLDDYLNGCLKKIYKSDIKTLSTPIPKYELIDFSKVGDFLPVQAGRGCPNTCAFCSIACLYKGKYLRREIPEVIQDIKRVKELGFKKFLLIDDNILSDRKYTLDLCAEIKKLNMEWYSQCAVKIADDAEVLSAVAGSGCTFLSFGLESVQKQNLESVNKAWEDPADYADMLKRVADAGIDIASEMMIGLEHDTKESIRQTAEFVIDNKIAAPKFYIVTPIPGTPFLDEVKNKGNIVNDNIYEYSPSKSAIRTNNLSCEEIDEMYWWIYNEVYSVKNIIKRVVLNKHMLKYPRRTLFVLGVNLFYRYHIKQHIAPIII